MIMSHASAICAKIRFTKSALLEDDDSIALDFVN